MTEQLRDLQSIKKEELLPEEVEWLNSFIKYAFRKKVTKRDIVFTKDNDTDLTYFRIPYQELLELENKQIPNKFLETNIITTTIPENDTEEGYFAKIELVYWCFKNVKDVFGFYEILDTIFGRVMFGDLVRYDKQAKGYKVQPKHLEKRYGKWSAIRKTLLIGFAVFLGLFQRTTVPPLVEIYEGLKNKTLKLIGLSKADREAFGKTAHYQKLNLCWNCGWEINAPGGLCKDCYDYWDERTK